MNNPVQLMQALQRLKANPAQMLLQRKLNVPQNMMNDPQQIVNYLLQTGQVQQSQVNQAIQSMQNYQNQYVK